MRFRAICTVIALLLALSVLATRTEASITYTGAHVVAQSTDDNSVTTGNIDATGASLLVACVGAYNGAGAPTFSDSTADVWTALTERDSTANGGVRVKGYYKTSPTSGNHQLTASGTGSFPSIEAAAFSGTATSSPLASENGNAINAGDVSMTTGSVSPASTALVFSCLGMRDVVGTMSINSSFTITDQADDNAHSFATALSYKLSPSASENPTWSWVNSSTGATEIAVFSASGAGVAATVRHEINILDGLLSATSGNSASSNEIAHLDTSKYGTPTYDFEIVGYTSSSLSVGITLRRAGTSTDDCTATIPTSTTTATLIRTTGCTLTSTDYVVFIPNTAGATKNVKEARIIPHDTNPNVSEVQVEIGNNESITGTTPTALASPKYWAYAAANWDGTPTFYAEIVYAKSAAGSGSNSTDTTAHTTTFTPYGIGSVQVEAYGGGGGGGGNSTTTDGGGGASGGGYCKKNTVTVTSGTAYSYTVGAKGTGVAGSNGNDGGASSFNDGSSNVCVANGGVHGSSASNGRGGGTFVSTGQAGDTTHLGGNGGAGRNNSTGTGGGSGGGAGSTGDGGAGGAGGASVGTAGSAGAGGGGAGAAGGAAAGGAGIAGSAPGAGGSGSGDKAASGDASLKGGDGADGKVIITWATSGAYCELQEDNGSFASWAKKAAIFNAGTATSATRARSSAFTPTDGRHYRIACARSDTTFSSVNVYAAKIVVDQSGTFNKLEEGYQLANTALAAGTSLQTFLSKYDTAEWSVYAQSFKHAVSSGGGSSVVEADTAGGTQITGSSVTASSAYVESGALTMPATGNIDMKATTNNSDVYGDRIVTPVTLVQPSSNHNFLLMGVGK